LLLNKNLTAGELSKAYKRVGAAFKRQLQQNFVVLNEKGVAGAACGSVNAVPAACQGSILQMLGPQSYISTGMETNPI
jgi:hypothetical protein